eukprot:261402-Pelagomonas_calceolata.AAC.2
MPGSLCNNRSPNFATAQCAAAAGQLACKHLLGLGGGGGKGLGGRKGEGGDGVGGGPGGSTAYRNGRVSIYQTITLLHLYATSLPQIVIPGVSGKERKEITPAKRLCALWKGSQTSKLARVSSQSPQT